VAAFGAGEKHSLTLVGRPELKGCIGHLVVAAVTAFSLHNWTFLFVVFFFGFEPCLFGFFVVIKVNYIPTFIGSKHFWLKLIFARITDDITTLPQMGKDRATSWAKTRRIIAILHSTYSPKQEKQFQNILL